MAPSLTLETETKTCTIKHPFLRRLLDEGSKVEGHNDKLEKAEEIPWIDFDLLAKGRKFANENYAFILLALMFSDTVGFMTKQIASVVFENFYPNNVCGQRFLSTFRTAFVWIQSEDYSHDSKFMKETRRVRALHKVKARPIQNNRSVPKFPPKGLEFPPEYKELIKSIQKDLEAVEIPDEVRRIVVWNPSLYFSQLDVALVQIGSLLPFLLMPEIAGVDPYERNEGMRGFFHQWAVLGRMLGLQDKYNLALNPDKELYLEIINKVGLPAFKLADESVIFSMETMLKALFRTLPFTITTKSLLAFSFKVYNHYPNNLVKSFSVKDFFCYYFLSVYFFLGRFSFFKLLSNYIAWALLTIYSKLYLK